MAVKKSAKRSGVVVYCHIFKTVHLVQSKGMKRLTFSVQKGHTDMFRDN